MSKISNFFWLLFIIISFSIPASLFAQVPDQSLQKSSKPNLFLDCNGCYKSYLKQHINLVNFVRDKNDAQIHLLMTRARTGSGGVEYTMTFIGKKQFETRKDTLVYVSPQSDTNEDTRVGLANYVKIGLTPFLAKTSLVKYMGVNFLEIDGDDQAQKDIWNYWVFEINGFSSLSGEESRSSFEFDGEINANRITEKWKIEFQTNANYQRERFKLDNGENFTSIETRKQLEALAVKSLSDHWSAGLSSEISSSSYRNIDLQLTVSPAVEYNIYPYKEYNEHQFNFLYRVSPSYFQYQDTTIFNKTEQFLVKQSLQINYQVTQTWGFAESSLEGSTFLYDLSKNRLDFRGEIDFRVFRGFSVNAFGRYSLINNQIALPKANATNEEALLQLRQQATGYEFRVGFGLSYSFGSIYNNIVNPRF